MIRRRRVKSHSALNLAKGVKSPSLQILLFFPHPISLFVLFCCSLHLSSFTNLQTYQDTAQIYLSVYMGLSTYCESSYDPHPSRRLSQDLSQPSHNKMQC